jgi:dynein heavy chain
MVYLTPEELGWKPMVKTWIYKHFDYEDILNNNEKAYLYETFEFVIDMGLEKMREHYHEPVVTVDIQQVKSICNFLEIFLKPEMGFKANSDLEKQKLLNNIFAWCYTWGMGGSLDDRSKERFDDVVKDAFKMVQYPPGVSAFDVFFDLKRDKTFKLWNTKVPGFEFNKDVQYFDLMVPTTDTYKYGYCLEMLLSNEKHIFFTGDSGVGKSCVIQQILTKLGEDGNMVTIPINFSAQTTSKRTQSSVEEKLEKKKRTLLGAGNGKKIAIFVDDINMPAVEEYGAQPPIEFLRLFIDRRGLYDRLDWQWKDVEDTTIIACAAPPGGGRSITTPRFTRHFNMFSMPQADRTTLTKIFGSILGGFLKSGF